MIATTLTGIPIGMGAVMLWTVCYWLAVGKVERARRRARYGRREE